MAEQLTATDPARLGRYTVLGRLGAGGQGVVYLARAEDGRQVAVKALRTDVPLDPDAVELLAREARAASRVAPFCTARVLDVALDHDPAYVVTEYVPGPTLSHQVRGHGPLDEQALDRLAVATLTALHAIHRARLVHRDVKPANVILGPDGPRLIDFGIARDLRREPGTVTASSWGTPEYSPPELLQGRSAEPPGDVFAWACTLAFAATGRSPFAGPQPAAVMHRVLTGEPDLDGVPERLRSLLAACLSRDPADRPSAEQARDLLTEPPPDDEQTLPLRRPSPAVTEPAPTAPTVPAPAPTAPTAAAPAPTAPTATVAATPPTTALPADPAGPDPAGPDPAGPDPAGPDPAGPGQPDADLLFEPSAGPGGPEAPAAGTAPAGPPPAGPPTAGTAPAAGRRGPRRRRLVPLLAAAALLVPGYLALQRDDPPAAPEQGRHDGDLPFDGTWEGSLVRAGGAVAVLQLELEIDGDEGDYELRHQDCKGSVTVLARTATTLTAALTAKEPSASCPASAEVSLRREGEERATASWREPGDAAAPASGSLRSD